MSSKKELITVCIPAHNEENTIRQTILSVLNQKNVIIKEVIIGANACEDNTEAIVKEIARENSLVKLIHIAKVGKPNAMNILYSRATTKYIIFTDADVFIPDYSFYALINFAEHNPDYILIGGVPYPDISYEVKGNPIRQFGKKLPVKLFYEPHLYYGVISKLMLLNKEKLDKKYKESTYKQIPANVIRDDTWLSLFVGDGKWALCKESHWIARYPCGIREIFSAHKRGYLGGEQIRVEHPLLWNNSKVSMDKKNFLSRYLTSEGELGLFKRLLYLPIMLPVMLFDYFAKIKGKMDYYAGNYLPGSFERLSSTKNILGANKLFIT